MDHYSDPQIKPATYEWSARIVTTLKKILRVHLKLHHSKDHLNAGEIFLFNHFARFETFIPQYLIYQETGALCRSVAASNFFVEGSAFSNYLFKGTFKGTLRRSRGRCDFCGFSRRFQETPPPPAVKTSSSRSPIHRLRPNT